MAIYGKGTILGNTIPVIDNVNDVVFFDIKEYMSQKGADLLFGQGFKVLSESDEIKGYLNNIKDMNQMDSLMLQVAKDTNYYGRTILTIDKSVNGEFTISFTNTELFQNVSLIEITPVRAVLLKKKVFGMQIFYIQEIWDTKKVTRSLTIEDNGVQRSINEKDVIPEELKIPKEEIHNLGFCPIIQITNKPARNFLMTQQTKQLQDDYSVAPMATHINNGLKEWYKEEIKGTSKVFLNYSEQELNKLKSQNSSFPIADYFFKTNVGEKGEQVTIQPSSYNASPWTEAMKSKCNLYSIGCGYSPIFPEVADPTEAESLLSRDADQRTTKAKRRVYQLLLTDLFAKILVYAGKFKNLQEAKDNFSIEITENVIYNRLQLTDFLVSNIQNQLMSRAEAILMARDLDSIEEAEEVIKYIDKEFEEDQVALQQMLPQDNINDPQGMGNASPNGDPRQTE